jgi:hypothetical protein
MLSRLAMISCLVSLWGSATAFAEDHTTTYAIVVGSNTGGPGQTDLRYAEDDARRVASLLTDLGGYTADQVDTVVHPTPDQLREHLDKLTGRVAADAAAGRQARVFFYYSGHARAQAIDLGSTEMPLDELRTRLFKIPATLTVVVLDACQSGAFSRIKGAQPAADFSYSSRQHLDATGIAVLASSSGSELSQESEQLKSSYFTHHFLVGLRGAGDSNNDGEVSIDEAYRYAYHQTLLATAETAVGGQHVTFEADLKGHGEVPLSYPRAATAQLTLPARAEGKTLVEDRRSHTVVAETYKAKGEAVRIAVAPGEYDVLVRHGNMLSRCHTSAPGEVDIDHCSEEAIVATLTKGGGDFEPYPLQIGVSGVLRTENGSGYTRNLANFGYYEYDDNVTTGVEAHALTYVRHGFWVGVRGSYTPLPQWRHDIVGSDEFQTLDWNSSQLTAMVRWQGEPTDGHWFHVIADGWLGGALGTVHTKAADGTTYNSDYYGVAAGGQIGLRFDAGPFGFEQSIGYEAATGITDLIGNSHTSGGLRMSYALTLGF